MNRNSQSNLEAITRVQRGKMHQMPNAGKDVTGVKRGKTGNRCQPREKLMQPDAIFIRFDSYWLRRNEARLIGQKTLIGFSNQ